MPKLDKSGTKEPLNPERFTFPKPARLLGILGGGGVRGAVFAGGGEGGGADVLVF